MSGAALLLGANGLIGEAIADELARPGRRLVLVARDAERLRATSSRLRENGNRCDAVAVYATDDDALADLIAAARPLDVAVNNLGAAHRPASLDRLDLGDVDRVLSVTLRAVLVAMKHELAALRDGGTLVNVASSAGTSGVAGMSAYAAAKHAVVGLTRSAALDVAHRGVRVNAVAPGPIASGGLAAQPASVRADVGRHVPLGRIGRAEEVARVVGWLTAPASSYVTGAVIPVDGGKSA